MDNSNLIVSASENPDKVESVKESSADLPEATDAGNPESIVDSPDKPKTLAREKRECGGQLYNHGIRGRALEALLRLHQATFRTGRFYKGSPRSNKEARLNLIKFIAEEQICTRRWAREIVNVLFSTGWLESSTFKGHPAIRVRQHREWAFHVGSACSLLVPAEEETSSKKELSSPEKEEPSSKRLLSPVGETLTGRRLKESFEERKEKEGGETANSTNLPSPDFPLKEAIQKKEKVPDRENLSEEVFQIVKIASAHRRKRYGRNLRLEGKDLKSAMALVEKFGADNVADSYKNYMADDSSGLCDRKHPFGIFAKQIEENYLEWVEVEKHQKCRCGNIRTVVKTVRKADEPWERTANLCWTCDECEAIEQGRKAAEETVSAGIPKETLSRWCQASRDFDEFEKQYAKPGHQTCQRFDRAEYGDADFKLMWMQGIAARATRSVEEQIEELQRGDYRLTLSRIKRLISACEGSKIAIPEFLLDALHHEEHLERVQKAQDEAVRKIREQPFRIRAEVE
jgi:hypothetical protein